MEFQFQREISLFNPPLSPLFPLKHPHNTLFNHPPHSLFLPPSLPPFLPSLPFPSFLPSILIHSILNSPTTCLRKIHSQTPPLHPTLSSQYCTHIILSKRDCNFITYHLYVDWCHVSSHICVFRHICFRFCFAQSFGFFVFRFLCNVNTVQYSYS